MELNQGVTKQNSMRSKGARDQSRLTANQVDETNFSNASLLTSSLATAIPALLCQLDAKLFVTAANPSFERAYPLQPVCGRSLLSILGEETFRIHEAYLRRAWLGETVEFEIEQDQNVVDPIWFCIQCSPLKAASGKIIGVLEHASRITKYKSAEAELLGQQARGRYLAKVSVTLSATLDLKSILDKLVHLGAPDIAEFCCVQVFKNGRLRLEAVAHSAIASEKAAWATEQISDDAASPRLSQFRIAARRAYESGKSVHIEASAPIGGGDSTDLRLLCVPIFVRGRSYGALSFVRTSNKRPFRPEDISMAEDVCLRASLAIDNAQLYAESEAIHRIKDEFLASLSHELRTPLNVICGYSEILEQERASLSEQEIQNSIEAIARNARLQSATVNSLLDLSKLVTGQIVFQPKRTALRSLLQNVCEIFRATADSKQIQLECSVAGAPNLIFADANRLRQILWNLLSNAVKFTEPGGRIDVRARDKGSFCEISIRDSGRGIDAEFLPYIFDRFRQEDSSSSKKYGGLGLGLAISRHLIEIHGGTIRAESPGAGRGATMTFTLPTIAEPKDRENSLQ